MRKLILSDIAAGVRMPIKKGTMQFLQDAYTEMFEKIILEKIGGKGIAGGTYYDSTKAYVLYGCEQTPLGGTTRFEEGVIFFNGEILISPFQIVTDPAGSDVFIANIGITQYTTNADPVTFSDLNTYDVHDIRTVTYTTGATGTGDIDDYDNFLRDLEFSSKDIVFGATFSNVGSILGTPVNDASFKINGSIVHLSGTITGDLGGTTTTLLTLPVKARPEKEYRSYITYLDGSSAVTSILLINTSGLVRIITSSSSSGVVVFLDNISFRRF